MFCYERPDHASLLPDRRLDQEFQPATVAYKSLGGGGKVGENVVSELRLMMKEQGTYSKASVSFFTLNISFL